MEELIKMVAQKAGISNDQAQAAVDTVLKFLKGKLPGPVGSQVEGILKGSDVSTQVTKKLGGLFGKK